MACSAGRLGLPFNSGRARDALDALLRTCSGAARVRVALCENGEFSAEAGPIGDAAALWRYALSACHVDSRDPLLRHKTSRRRFFDRERAQWADCAGCDEVLFLNENDELTEGSRSSIFVERGGRLLTPHIDCGLLDGCLRRELLDRGRCSEERLSRADLESADRVFLGNSLRGLVRALPL